MWTPPPEMHLYVCMFVGEILVRSIVLFSVHFCLHICCDDNDCCVRGKHIKIIQRIEIVANNGRKKNFVFTLPKGTQHTQKDQTKLLFVVLGFILFPVFISKSVSWITMSTHDFHSEFLFT